MIYILLHNNEFLFIKKIGRKHNTAITNQFKRDRAKFSIKIYKLLKSRKHKLVFATHGPAPYPTAHSHAAPKLT
jgi:hypothetical protein